MAFILRQKLNQGDAQASYDGLVEWFLRNPTRRVCRTDWGNVHRKDDLEKFILSYSLPGVTLTTHKED